MSIQPTTPFVEALSLHLMSKAISALQIFVWLALAGCSAKDETVAPPQPQGPTIVAQPTVVVSDLGARITATVNPNGIDTECYFEYGPTATYGRQLPTKLIEAKLCDVVISDTIANLGIDTTYHCRLVAASSAGTTQSTDQAFSVANTSPTIVSETSVSVFGNTAVLAAMVNADYRSTDCYFEYGQNTSYGMHTAAKSIGAGGSGVVVKDTIKDLSWDTTYHCRLVAENAAGKTIGSDQSFICSSAGWANFVFPLDAGTTWNYTYSYTYRHVGGGQQEDTRGRQVWRSIGSVTSNSVKILVTKIDTTRTWWPYVGADTATAITQVDTSFSVIVTPDSLYIEWYQLARHGYWSQLQSLFRIPRVVEQNTETLTLQFSRMKAVYVSGKGLTSWEDYNSTNYFWDERLILESMSP